MNLRHPVGTLIQLKSRWLVSEGNRCVAAAREVVIENERVSVVRERRKTIQRELRDLLSGNLPEVVYDRLVVRR